MRSQLDAVDVQLITLLQRNARSSLRQLAEAVFMSPPAVAARLTRLEQCGVIQGYQVLLSPAALGYDILAFVSVQVQPADKPRFKPFIESLTGVLECCSVTGDYSMLVKVCFHTTAELDAFVGSLQHYGKTYTQIVFSTPVPPRGPRVLILEPTRELAARTCCPLRNARKGSKAPSNFL